MKYKEKIKKNLKNRAVIAKKVKKKKRFLEKKMFFEKRVEENLFKKLRYLSTLVVNHEDKKNPDNHRKS